MTDPGTVVAAALALGLSAAAAWLHRPSVEALEGERWFKVALATLLRGATEAGGGDAAAWERAVRRFVPYHPACRDAGRALSTPHLGVAPGPPRVGERALMDALAAEASGEARWRALFEGEASLDALMGDPADLDAPEDVLGPEGAWEALARVGAGDAAAWEALRTRVDATWVVVEGHGPCAALGEALAAAAGPRAVRVPVDRGVPEALVEVLSAADARWVAVGVGEGAPRVLRALVSEPALRDRLLAMLSIGGVLGGWSGQDGTYGEAALRDELAARFRADVLDTERSRITPYLSVQATDRGAAVDGVPGLSVAAQRFPPPPEVPSVSTLEAVDLGVLPVAEDLPLPLVARALMVVTARFALREGR